MNPRSAPSRDPVQYEERPLDFRLNMDIYFFKAAGQNFDKHHNGITFVAGISHAVILYQISASLVTRAGCGVILFLFCFPPRLSPPIYLLQAVFVFFPADCFRMIDFLSV